MKKNRKPAGYSSTIAFLISVYIVLALIAEIAAFVANHYIGEGNNALFVTLFVLPASAVVAAVATILVNRRMTSATVKMSAAINRVARGDFNARIEPEKIDGRFNEVYKNFNKMAEELSSVQTLREDYVRNFSHEIKTPIAAINGYAKLLADGGLDEAEKREIIDIIIKQTENLSRLSQNILLLSKIENQKVAGESREFRLDLQIKDCIIMLAPQWEGKNITISSDLANVTYVGDEGLLRHVWVNLLSNAIKFTPDGGEITVTLSQKGDKIAAVVADNGIGMTEEQAAHAFEKYYQAADKSGIGSGLGLTICKRICELEGCTISVKSVLGEGSAFTVEL